MPFEFKLAWRYARARRKSLARFTAVVAIVGIAAGVASLIIAQALAQGFAEEVQDKILANTAHVSIFSADGAEIENWREIKTELEKLENVRQISPTVYENAILISNDTINHAFLRVVSNSFPKDQKPKTENRQIQISVGAELAAQANLKIGDEAEIIVPSAVGANQSEPARVKVLIGETFRTGLYDYDLTWIRLSPESYAALHGERSFTPKNLDVAVKDIYQSNETAQQIRQIAGAQFRVIDWQEANQPLFAALSLERKVALAIISLIIFIAALNITTTLALLVNERRLDIAILRTCGARTRSLVSIFLLEGLFLGLVGIASGVVLGLLACFAANYFKVINLSSEVYSLNHITLRPHLSSTLLIILIAFLLCLLATVYPAFKASRIKPLENLRAQ